MGGGWVADANLVLTTLAEHLYNPKIVSWDLVTNVQQTFPPINHDDHMNYLFGHQQLIDAINALSVVFGDLNAGYLSRPVGTVSLKRFDEKYGAKNQIGFVAFQSWDSKVQQGKALAGLKHAAS